MYKTIKGNVVHRFNTYTQLINWISMHNRFTGTSFSNSFLAHAGINAGDIYYQEDLVGISITSGYYPRTNKILGSNGKSIYDSGLVADVKNHEFDQKLEYARISEMRKLTKPKTQKRVYPEFRRGPVPSLYGHFKYNVLRHIKTTNELRLTHNPEMSPYNRGSRGKSLPSYYDDINRTWGHNSWKVQGKRSHQWDKKPKHNQHEKGLYIIKQRIVKEEDD